MLACKATVMGSRGSPVTAVSIALVALLGDFDGSDLRLPRTAARRVAACCQTASLCTLQAFTERTGLLTDDDGAASSRWARHMPRPHPANESCRRAVRMISPAGGRSHSMAAMLWLPLVGKALATALIVISASVAAEALGPVWGAIIASLPVSAGPAYVFLAMQHGPDFLAISALNSAAANAATGLFLITYVILGPRMSPWRSLGAAVGVWLAASLAIQQTAWTVTAAVALNLAVYGAGLVLRNRDVSTHCGSARPEPRRSFDLLLRAAAVAAFVSLVVAISAALGPAATGIAAVFPVSLISLIVILRSRLGAPASVCLATSALLPMLGFGVMLVVMHIAAQPLGVTAAFGFALAACAIWSGIPLLLEAYRRYA